MLFQISCQRELLVIDLLLLNSVDHPFIQTECDGNKSLVTFSVNHSSRSRYVLTNFYRGTRIQNNNLEVSLLLHPGVYNTTICVDEGVYMGSMEYYNDPAHLSVSVGTLPVPIHYTCSTLQESFIFSTSILLNESSMWEKTTCYQSNWYSLPLSIPLGSCESSSQSFTDYFRSWFVIPEESKYLAFAVEYTGGFTAYVNGTKVAQFNLPLNYDSNTHGESDVYTRDYFTIPVLDLKSPVMISIEIHSPNTTVFPSPIVHAWPLIDSKSHLYHSLDVILSDGTTLHNPGMTLQVISELSIQLDSNVFSIQFSFPNRVPVNWNSARLFGLSYDSIKPFTIKENGLSFSVSNVTSISLFKTVNYTYHVSYELKLIAFRVYQFYVFGSPVSSVRCNYGGDGFVEEGGLMMMSCPAGMYGNSVYQCRDNKMELYSKESCFYHEPEEFSYNSTSLVFPLGVYTEFLPSQSPTVTHFVISSSLDIPGLKFNTTNGLIYGIAKELKGPFSYVVGGNNPDHLIATVTKISISVILLNCSSESGIVIMNETIWKSDRWKNCLYGKRAMKCSVVNHESVLLEVDKECALDLGSVLSISLIVCIVCLLPACIVRYKELKLKTHELPITR